MEDGICLGMNFHKNTSIIIKKKKWKWRRVLRREYRIDSVQKLFWNEPHQEWFHHQHEEVCWGWNTAWRTFTKITSLKVQKKSTRKRQHFTRWTPFKNISKIIIQKERKGEKYFGVKIEKFQSKNYSGKSPTKQSFTISTMKYAEGETPHGEHLPK